MKIPKKLKIGGHIFTVKEDELEDCAGQTQFSKLEIKIKKDMKQSAKESTLIHEIVCHCINTTFAGESMMAHAFMDSISEQIFQVLSDNNMLK